MPCPQRLAFIGPSLAVAGKPPPKGDQWVHEAKWDGFRIQVIKDGSDVRSFSKTGTDWTTKLPAIVEASRRLGYELKLPGRNGRPLGGSLDNVA